MLHRSISAFVRLINGDQLLSYLLLMGILLIGGATVSFVAHEAGVVDMVWDAAQFDPTESELTRIGTVGMLLGMYTMLGIWYAIDKFYEVASNRCYKAAAAEEGHVEIGCIGHGLGYYSGSVNGKRFHSRFAPR